MQCVPHLAQRLRASSRQFQPSERNRLEVILIRRNGSRTGRTGKNIEIYTMTKRRVDMHTNRKIPWHFLLVQINLFKWIWWMAFRFHRCVCAAWMMMCVRCARCHWNGTAWNASDSMNTLIWLNWKSLESFQHKFKYIDRLISMLLRWRRGSGGRRGWALDSVYRDECISIPLILEVFVDDFSQFLGFVYL